jgi:hypothetical protein
MSVDEFVAVVPDQNGDRNAFHEIDEDGEVTCPAGNNDALTFDIVPLRLVSDALKRCAHCSGEVEWTAGQGSTLAAALAAADPDEVGVQ